MQERKMQKNMFYLNLDFIWCRDRGKQQRELSHSLANAMAKTTMGVSFETFHWSQTSEN